MKACVSSSLGCSTPLLHSISILASIVFLCAASAAQQVAIAAGTSSAPQPLIRQAIDEAQLTVLKGNTHPLARPQYDLGTAPATLPLERMLLVLKRSPEQESALRKLLDDQHDKHSPNYHHWLAPEEFGKRFGPTDADMQTITGWLQSHGFQVGTTKGRTVLEFSGSASQVQEAFHTTIHKYVVNGDEHWANSSDPSIPTALTPAVAGVFTLHDFLKKPFYKLAKERIEATWNVGKPPEFTASNGLHALAPADYAIIYNINPVYNGAPKATPAVPVINGNGITIGVVGRSDIDLTDDIQPFRQVFGISGPTPQVIVNGPDPGDVPGDDIEGTLDVSWSGAIAPGAQVDFVNSAVTNTTDGVVLSEIYIIENNLSNIMTYSFGACELAEGSGYVGEESLAEQAAAQGITFMASTGDAGAEGCDDPNSETVAQYPISVNLPAATPFTTAVGGTMFNETAGGLTAAAYWSSTNMSNQSSALSYIPEDVWNESCVTSCQFGDSPNISAGGGGVSVDFTKPSWQANVAGIPNDGARDVPDVALSAAAGNDPYLLCFQSSCIGNAQNEISFFAVGGTSASTPSFAGIMALIDEKMSLMPPINANDTSARQGLANYALYPLAAAQQAAKTSCNASATPALAATSGCVFNDVTVGNNAVPGETGYGTSTALYQAGTGYDQASGLGSMNVANLVDQWAASTFTPTTTTLTLTPPSGETTLLAIPHGSSVGVEIGVTASSGTPAGEVSLIAAIAPDGSTGATGLDGFALGTNGSVSTTTQQLPGGTYTVTAHYAGVSTPTFFAPSDSTSTQVTVLPENSTIALCQLTLNSSGAPVSLPNGSSVPFGSFVFVRADVTGASGQGAPTGSVNFIDSFGSLPGSLTGFSPVSNPEPLVADSNNCTSNGTSIKESNTSIGDGVINFDAGNHSISASYAGDNSFNKSSSAAPVTFTIQPGFTGVSGLGNVTISAPGASGTTTIGIIASSNFTTAISFACSGLPSEATCSSSSATGQGPNTIVTTTITVSTTAPTTRMLEPKHRTYYFARIFGGGLPLAGIFLIASPKRRRAGAILGLMMLAFLVMLPACGGGGNNGGGGQKQQNPGTPAGTSTVTVTATAGSLTQTEGTFTLTIQ
jgi:Pro-kumamolisin, activation domain